MSFEEIVRETFTGQRLLSLMGAQLTRVALGEVDISLRFREDLGQQNGSLHAGTIAAIADTACGLAALTRMNAGSNVVSVEFKVNLLEPSRGEQFLAKGRVVRAGRNITFCSGEVLADGKLVATIAATMMQIRPR
jgi:uncharacterized protein (TIGR00369 family)